MAENVKDAVAREKTRQMREAQNSQLSRGQASPEGTGKAGIKGPDTDPTLTGPNSSGTRGGRTRPVRRSD